MPTSSDQLHARLQERLSSHGSTDLQAQIDTVVDLQALEAGRYAEVLETVNRRLTTIRYSIVSMLVAGIYFGLLVGAWLVDTPTLESILLWGLPVGLVTLYAVYSGQQILREGQHLSEARSLLRVLAERDRPS